MLEVPKILEVLEVLEILETLEVLAVRDQRFSARPPEASLIVDL